MKILVGACGSFGHVTPFIGLCERLRDMGHEIVFAVNSENLSLFEKYDFTAKSYMSLFKDGDDIPYDNFDDLMNYIVRRVQHDSFDYFDNFNELMEGVDLVLRDSHCPLAYIAAEYNNVPCVDVLISPMFFTEGLRAGNGCFGLTKYNELLTKLGLPARETTPFFIWYQDNLKIAVYPEFCVSVNKSVVPDFFSHPNIRFTNFPTLPSTNQLSDEVEEFLANGEPPVVFAMSTGSTVSTSPSNFWEIAYELGKNIKRSILLIPQGNFEPHENILFLPGIVSHDTLFPRCSMVVNGGGFGTIARILSHNIPQVSVPQMDENRLCADLMSDMMMVVYPEEFTYDTFAPLMLDPKFNIEVSSDWSQQINSCDGVEMIIDILKEYKYLNG